MMKTKDMMEWTLDLRLFDEPAGGYDPNTQTTGSDGLSEQMRTFYSDYLIDYATPELIHGQFGQKRNIPANSGKTITFDVTTALPKITTPLKEGVTPTGQDMDWGTLSATVAQYGGYITISDIADLTAARKQLTEAARRLGDQAGRSVDTLDREVLVGGSNVIYADGTVSTRGELVGGQADGNHYLTVRALRLAVRALKSANAKKIDGSWVGIIGPDSEFDLMDDPEWKYPHQYCDPENQYEGEIGRIAGIRFVETTEAKKFVAPGLTEDTRELTAAASATESTSVKVSQALEADALVGREVLIGGRHVEVTANTTDTLTLSGPVSVTSGGKIYPGEAGSEGRDVYATLVLGAEAYGVTEIEGGGLEMIIKPVGSGDDPLNQRATAGWKTTHVCVRLVEEYMVRVEHTSTFNDHEAN